MSIHKNSSHENSSHENSSHENDPRDMIKEILQKIIDEMNTLESDRIMPEHRKPKAMAVEVKTAHQPDEVRDMVEDEEGLDPVVLDELMTKAGSADETGALPEDAQDDFPLEISEAVRRKREKRLSSHE